ncbi:MAG: triose-phosphate isomerase [Deltaproteobacteria bacterium]|nr:triose-phosphate isomerase [Deltaproteobacteria bacterium]
MLKPLIAGNWKMNTTVHQGVDLVIKLRELLKGADPDEVEVVLAPPFTSIHHISHIIADSHIRLCGQNLHWEKGGAYTGEVSADMLISVGCRYVIIGHSERRELFKETDEMVNKKVLAALKAGLRPIICVGETLDERELGKTISKVQLQIKKALSGLAGGALKDIAIAYEPIWAIGTGRTATPQMAEEVHNALRELLFELYDTDSVKSTRVIYGGSVKPDNIDSLMAQPNIDGALVGGASLKAEDFARIVKFRHL